MATVGGGAVEPEAYRNAAEALCQMPDDKLGRAFGEFNIKFMRVCTE